MSIEVYKDGVKSLVEHTQLQNHLNAGYTLTLESEVKEETKPEVEAPTMDDEERTLRDEIKAMGGSVGGRASLETIREKHAELLAAKEG